MSDDLTPTAPFQRGFRSPTRVTLRNGLVAEVLVVVGDSVLPLRGRAEKSGQDIWWTNGGRFRPDDKDHRLDIVAVQHDVDGPMVPVYRGATPVEGGATP